MYLPSTTPAIRGQIPANTHFIRNYPKHRFWPSKNAGFSFLNFSARLALRLKKYACNWEIASGEVDASIGLQFNKLGCLVELYILKACSKTDVHFRWRPKVNKRSKIIFNVALKFSTGKAFKPVVTKTLSMPFFLQNAPNSAKNSDPRSESTLFGVVLASIKISLNFSKVSFALLFFKTRPNALWLKLS